MTPVLTEKPFKNMGKKSLKNIDISLTVIERFVIISYVSKT